MAVWGWMFQAEGTSHIEVQVCVSWLQSKEEVGIGQPGEDDGDDIMSRWLDLGINQEDCKRASFFPLQTSTSTLKWEQDVHMKTITSQDWVSCRDAMDGRIYMWLWGQDSIYLSRSGQEKKMVVEFSVPFYFLWGFFPLIFYTYPFSTCTLSILIWDMISFVNFELLYYKSIN